MFCNVLHVAFFLTRPPSFDLICDMSSQATALCTRTPHKWSMAPTFSSRCVHVNACMLYARTRQHMRMNDFTCTYSHMLLGPVSQMFGSCARLMLTLYCYGSITYSRHRTQHRWHTAQPLCTCARTRPSPTPAVLCHFTACKRARP
jgi:hypothetical protein